MKPVPFDYVRPQSIEEACAALARDDSVIIAGGQTLIPMLAMRLARPASIVDIARIQELAGIRVLDGGRTCADAQPRHGRWFGRQRRPGRGDPAGAGDACRHGRGARRHTHARNPGA